MQRREFLRSTLAGVGVLSVPGLGASCLGATGASAGASMPASAGQAALYSISLAQWSLHRTLRRGDLDPLDFPAVTRDRYGLDGVEYVNQFFMDRARDREWLGALKRAADEAGVRSLLIMCDGEGALGDPDPEQRTTTVENHRKWLEAAEFLDCHSIRVNARSSGSREEQARLAADGLRRLCEYAEPSGLNVIVENHGGFSSDAEWLTDVIRRVDHPLAGTLPDFGNFRVSDEREYDRYLGVEQLMPYAEAVSAKSYAFGEAGGETTIDYPRVMRIVLDAGYRGYVGIEYEGDGLSEHEGILATRRLLERTRDQLADENAT